MKTNINNLVIFLPDICSSFLISFFVFFRFSREESTFGHLSGVGAGETKLEQEFIDNIRYGDIQVNKELEKNCRHFIFCCNFFLLSGNLQALRKTSEDPGKTVTLSQNWRFVKKCTKEVIGTGNEEFVKKVKTRTKKKYDCGLELLLIFRRSSFSQNSSCL